MEGNFQSVSTGGLATESRILKYFLPNLNPSEP